MDKESVFVMLNHEDMDKILAISSQVTEILDKLDIVIDNGRHKKLSFSELPATVTINDIKKYFGVSRFKWMGGVERGIYPKPLKWFTKPRRWDTDDVKMALLKNTYKGRRYMNDVEGEQDTVSD